MQLLKLVKRLKLLKHLQGHSILHLLYAGPAGPIDDDGDVSTS